MTATLRPIEILLVDDSPGDVRLTLESFKDSLIANTIHCVNDGVEALEYLRDIPNRDGTEYPDLILLDLDMPNMDGRELLSIIKQDDNLKQIPVIVLTISPSDQDILTAYGLHANSYITKPVELDDFVGVLRAFEGFWLSVVKLPRRS